MSTLGSFNSNFSTGQQLPALQFHFIGCPWRYFSQHGTSMQQEAALRCVALLVGVTWSPTPSFVVLLLKASLQGTEGAQVHSSVML